MIDSLFFQQPGQPGVNSHLSVMTVQMSNGDQQNVDPENNSTMPASEETNTARYEATHEQLVSVQSDINSSQSYANKNEQEKSSHLTNDFQKASNDGMFNSAQQNESFVSNQSSFTIASERLINFSESDLSEVEDALTKPRWALNVIPCNEFENLLIASLEIIKSDQFNNNELCQHFVTDTILQFFLKFYSDEIIDMIKPVVLVSDFTFKKYHQ